MMIDLFFSGCVKTIASPAHLYALTKLSYFIVKTQIKSEPFNSPHPPHIANIPLIPVTKINTQK